MEPEPDNKKQAGKAIGLLIGWLIDKIFKKFWKRVQLVTTSLHEDSVSFSFQMPAWSFVLPGGTISFYGELL